MKQLLHHQIAERLAEDVANGKLGGDMPVRALAQHYGVSYATMCKAVGHMRKVGADPSSAEVPGQTESKCSGDNAGVVARIARIVRAGIEDGI